MVTRVIGLCLALGLFVIDGVRAQELSTYEALQESIFIRGDANQDGRATLSDAYAILRYLNLGLSLSCYDAADVDDDGAITQIDVFALIGALFLGQTGGLSPYPTPGLDRSPDGLGCRSSRFDSPEGVGDPDVGGGAGDEDDLCEDPDGGADIDFLHFRGEVLARPGERSLRVPIYITTSGDVEAVSLSLHAPPDVARLEGLDFDTGLLQRWNLKPGWTHVSTRRQDEGYISGTVALSIAPEVLTLPPVYGGALAYLKLSILPDVPVGTTAEIRFRTTPAQGAYLAVPTEVSRLGASQRRRLCGIRIEVVSGEDVFIRGDSNRDRAVNIVDAVAILRYLFVSPSDPDVIPCLDAADLDDNGRIAVTDAVALVSYLFGRGPAPVLPFPTAGRDWSDNDPLGCED